MNKLLLPYDVYERHKKVSEYIGSSDTVVDIGGELNHLSQFCSPKKIVVANLNTGDVIISKNKLPFPANSFDVACSIDVLEHIPKDKRKDFIDNLIKISINKVVMSFPIGTKNHIQYEAKMQKLLESKKYDIKYLKEHIKYGLPEKDEVLKIVSSYKANLLFSGDIKVNELLFRIFIFDPRIKYIRKMVYYLKLIFNLCTNYIFYLLLSDKTYSQRSNRAYLIIYKQK